jgi:cyclin B
MFSFFDKKNNMKKGQNKKELDNSSKLVKKANKSQNNVDKRNTMFMKVSHNPLQQIQNKLKKKDTFLFEIQEENTMSSSRLSFLAYEQNALTKGAISQNKKSPEKIEIKDYFHSLLDDYGEDIFKHIKKYEEINMCDYSKDIFRLQDKKYFNEKNRSIIFNWLVKNNQKWRLKDDTIYMAMNIMDRFISKFKVENNEFQLVGISSYLIASKYEDIYPPYVDELSQICNFIYTTDDILKKEYEILVGLNFDILYNSSYKYLSFFHSVTEHENLKLFFLAQFILELSLENIEILEYSQSKRALASLLTAKKILQIKRSWNDLRIYYDYDENEIKKVQKKLIVLLNKVIKSKIKNGVFEKFESPRYKSVSSLLNNMCNNQSLKKQRNEDMENKTKYNDENKPYDY